VRFDSRRNLELGWQKKSSTEELSGRLQPRLWLLASPALSFSLVRGHPGDCLLRQGGTPTREDLLKELV
jgi:hypothetical protein